jgi:hypothetical protein
VVLTPLEPGDAREVAKPFQQIKGVCHYLRLEE